MSGTPAPRHSTLLFPVLALATSNLELHVLGALISEPPETGHALLLHAIASGLLLAASGWSLRRGWPRHRRDSQAVAWLLLLTGAVTLLGVAGALAALVGWLAWLRFRREVTPFAEWYRQLFPERHRNLAERLHDELLRTLEVQQDGSRVVPFVDVLGHGSRSQKYLAIGMMTRYFQPAFAPALRLALRDPDNSVRVQAATAMSNLENGFLDGALELEKRAGDDPPPTALLDLARHYDRHAWSGLLDEDRERRTRARALDAYRRYLEAQPDDADAHVAVGRLMLREGDTAEAAAWLAETRARFGAVPRLDGWYMEALYRLGRYDELREVARAEARQLAAGDAAMPQLLQASTRLWAFGLEGGAKP